jgi:hypothetical protein
MCSMQPFEFIALALYLLSYAGSGIFSLLRTSAFRSSELDFYSKGTIKWDLLFVFATGGLSFIALLLHVVLEGPRLGQILLYVQSTIFAVLLPLHFSEFFKNRMKGVLAQKGEAAYRSSGMKKLAVSLAMIILPLVIR